MKRGWINWDRQEISPAIFEARLKVVHRLLSVQDLPALCIYTDVWRSNYGRFFSNYMPYWNRALLVIPINRRPILLTSLSPRVYPWIHSISAIEEVRPAPKLGQSLLQLAAENQWQKIAILDLPQMPQVILESLRAGKIELFNLESNAIPGILADETEVALRRRALELGRRILDEELAKGVGSLDHHFVGALERRFRRAGAEEIQVLLSDGNSAPEPPKGKMLDNEYSVAISLEYRGHWIKVSRPHTNSPVVKSMREYFDQVRAATRPTSVVHAYFENLSGAYPYEFCDRSALGPGSIFALHIESQTGGYRFFYADTCRQGDAGAQVL